MKFSPELEKVILLRRYKRFLADVRIGNDTVTIHCANTGAMKNCVVENSPCWILNSQNSQRKYLYTWEIATTSTGHLAGINTLRANALVKEAILSGCVSELRGFSLLRAETAYGNSRFDFLLQANDETDKGGEKCYVEVKSVTYGLKDGLGIFPDAKSKRALKHICELMEVRAQGSRAVLLFCVQHNGIDRVSPADQIDPEYATALRLAHANGVEILAYKANISTEEIILRSAIPVEL